MHLLDSDTNRERGEREAPIRAGRGKQSEKRKSAGHFRLLVLAYKSASTNNKTNNKESQTKFHHKPIKRQNI